MKKKTIAGIIVVIVIAYTIGVYTWLDGMFSDENDDDKPVTYEDASKGNDDVDPNDTSKDVNHDTDNPNLNEDDRLDDESSDKKNEDETELIKEGIPSPLSGIYAPEEKVNRRPVAIMIDNHPRARWQAGLGQAEVVYEFRVEYPYTRYMAIFLINDPKHVGPIRSSRPYFVTALLEYDPVYVRVGGSQAAYDYIERLNLADIDGIRSSGFWRYYKTGKEAPNNMYSSMDVIRKLQKSRGFRSEGDYEGFNFHDKDTDIDGFAAENVLIKYNKSNSTKYEYDKEKKVYKRYKDNKLHIDELDGSEIEVKNIIIQRADTKVLDNDGRLDINIIGTGKGYYITNGKAINITWKKETEKSKTKYYNENGEEILFNSGQTWIQVTPQNTSININ